MNPESPLHEADIVYGTKIGRFSVVGELGAGGMGVVFSAHDKELDRKVALKVLRGSVASAEERTRMLREGQAMARVTHPNVITVYEVGSQDGLVYLAQELLDGGTLGQWLKKGTHAQDAILDKFIAAGRGLAAAHAAQLVHRDFKPDNVLLGKDGRVRVADFGLARAIGPADNANAIGPATRGTLYTEGEGLQSPMSPLTRTGAVMGTPMFMAPEQHEGGPTDARSDQFSFCVALYHALYGGWPFEGKTSVALADSVLHGRIQAPPRGHDVPGKLRSILVRGLSVDPAARYPDMDALLAELERVRAPRKSRLARVALWGGLAVLVAGAVGGGYALKNAARGETPTGSSTKPTKVEPVQSEWLSEAIERGAPKDAIVKYDLAAQVAKDAGDRTQAAIAQSASAIALVLGGRLTDAEARLRDAEASKGSDPLARAYADLAAASIALARGDLESALAKSQSCAGAFERPEPVLSALCLELQGNTAVEMGFAAGARKAYEQGLAIARQRDSLLNGITIQLALAELDDDEGRHERAAAQATAAQTAAAEQSATGPETTARIVLARALIAQAASQKALEVLEPVKPAALQGFQVRIAHAIALGQTQALLGDTTGLERIDTARAEADRQGFVGLVLAARLARVEVLTANGADDAKTEQEALIQDARKRGFHRIERRAQQ